jgi:hypothetical protein
MGGLLQLSCFMLSNPLVSKTELNLLLDLTVKFLCEIAQRCTYLYFFFYIHTGVGFSEATNGTPQPSHEDDVAADFDAFLQNFFRVFNGYETHNVSVCELRD